MKDEKIRGSEIHTPCARRFQKKMMLLTESHIMYQINLSLLSHHKNIKTDFHGSKMSAALHREYWRNTHACENEHLYKNICILETLMIA